MSGRHSLFIGRFQPLHANHIAIIRSLLAEGKKVCVAVMDTQVDDENPYTTDDRTQMLHRAFGDTIEIAVIPPIAEVCYGRTLGYGLREIVLDTEIPEISGTRIRKVVPELQSPRQPEFVRAFNDVAKEHHADMVKQGFWPGGDRNNGEALALIGSELTEVLEALRCGDPPDKDLPRFSAAEVQLADVIGRTMDLAQGRGWRVAEALLEKMRHNRNRPHKHGKHF